MANGQPDEKHLPTHKLDKLSEKVADDIHRSFKQNADDLKSHEVGRKDSNYVLNKGLKKAVERINKDMGNE